jgi:hypothetical protein
MQIRHVLAAALLSVAAASATLASPGRFLYVVGCDARLSKVDTLLDRKIGSVDLAARTQGHRIIPRVQRILDGCLSYQAVYDPSEFRFYTIVPLQAASKADGTKDYHALGFSVPGVIFQRNRVAGASLSEPPHLEPDGTGHVRIVNASDWSPRTDLDLESFGPKYSKIRNQLLETSGARSLLRIFPERSEELVIATADGVSKTLSYLRELPSTTARNVHLSPRGKAVLVEEIISNGELSEKTGRLVLYDASSGRVIKSATAPAVKSLSFLAISPSGKAVYHRNDTYRFVDPGRKFSAFAVSRPFSDGYSGYFFADR